MYHYEASLLESKVILSIWNYIWNLFLTFRRQQAWRTTAFYIHRIFLRCTFPLIIIFQGLMPDGTSRFSIDGKVVYHFMGCSTFSGSFEWERLFWDMSHYMRIKPIVFLSSSVSALFWFCVSVFLCFYVSSRQSHLDILMHITKSVFTSCDRNSTPRNSQGSIIV